MTTVLEQPRTAQRRTSPWLPILSATLPAGLLLFAAAMNWKQLPVIDRMGNDLLHNPWIAAAHILLESALALWLLTPSIPNPESRIPNARPRLRYGIINNHYAAISNPRPRIAALLTFSLFACVTAYRGIAGEDSCGCFGQFKVNPWITFALDLSVIALLLASLRSKSRPLTTEDTDDTEKAEPLSPSVYSVYSVVQKSSPAFSVPSVPSCSNPLLRPLQSPSSAPSAKSAVHTLRFACCGVALVVALTLWRMPSAPAANSTTTGIVRSGNLLILETDHWVGLPLPIARYIEPAGSLYTSGSAVMVIYSNDCDHCRDAVPKFRDAAIQSHRNTLFIEMPPYAPTGEEMVSPGGLVTVARLTDKHEWFASTPVVIELNNGIVQRAAEGKDADNIDKWWFREEKGVITDLSHVILVSHSALLPPLPRCEGNPLLPPPPSPWFIFPPPLPPRPLFEPDFDELSRIEPQSQRLCEASLCSALYPCNPCNPWSNCLPEKE